MAKAIWGKCRYCKERSRLVDRRCHVCDDCYDKWRERTDRKKAVRDKLAAVYPKLEEEYGSCCMICGREPKERRMNVDHCHTTGKVRGLLCYTCNYGLSWFRYSPELLRKAAGYMDRFK